MKTIRLAAFVAAAAIVVALGYLQMAGAVASSDDDTPVDWWEKPNCGGYDYPECGTDIDVPPELLAVTILVDGEAKAMPVVVSESADLRFAIEFAYPDCKLTGGHVFIVTDGAAVCVGSGGLPVNGVGPEIPGECSTAAVGEPYVLRIDPSFFVKGAAATYGLEISNSCATHSNRLPLEISTVDDDDQTADDDDDAKGGGSDDSSGGCGS
jgi:hypothetical protein